MNTLDDMRALVTGGNRGIGAAIAEALRAEGAEVVVWSSQDGDLSIPEAVTEMVVPDVDILVNNAGSQAHAPALEYRRYQWQYDMDLMLTAPFLLCQACGQHMVARGYGRIINIASLAGVNGTRNIIGYSVAKAGLIHMTKCLSNELAPHGVTVNAVIPGFIETDMLRPLMDDEKHSREILGRIPAGHYGKPADVAAAVLFLALPAADYITGACIPVDGGWLAR